LISPSRIEGPQRFPFIASRSTQDVTHVTVHRSVAGIRDGAFYGCHHLKSVLLHPGLLKIGARAFASSRYNDGCSSLERIRILSSVVEIGDGAFVNFGFFEWWWSCFETALTGRPSLAHTSTAAAAAPAWEVERNRVPFCTSLGDLLTMVAVRIVMLI